MMPWKCKSYDFKLTLNERKIEGKLMSEHQVPTLAMHYKEYRMSEGRKVGHQDRLNEKFSMPTLNYIELNTLLSQVTVRFFD